MKMKLYLGPREFGYKLDSIYGPTHNGVDIMAKVDTEVYPYNDPEATVMYNYTSPIYGKDYGSLYLNWWNSFLVVYYPSFKSYVYYGHIVSDLAPGKIKNLNKAIGTIRGSYDDKQNRTPNTDHLHLSVSIGTNPPITKGWGYSAGNLTTAQLCELGYRDPTTFMRGRGATLQDYIDDQTSKIKTSTESTTTSSEDVENPDFFQIIGNILGSMREKISDFFTNRIKSVYSAENENQTPSSYTNEQTQNNVKTPLTGSHANIEEKSIYYDTEYVSVRISYPEISGLLDKGLEEQINTDIMQEMNNAIDSSEQAAGEDSGYQYRVETSYEVERNDGAFLSLCINVYCESGGAHGEEYSLYYNVLNSNPGVVLSLSDLFVEGSDYISVLNEKIWGLIEQDTNLSQENYFTTITENQDFYLTDSELVVTFQKGDIASYIEDQPVFRVPLNEISGMVVPWLK